MTIDLNKANEPEFRAYVEECLWPEIDLIRDPMLYVLGDFCTKCAPSGRVLVGKQVTRPCPSLLEVSGSIGRGHFGFPPLDRFWPIAL
jgi:hypothetical protein